MEDRILLMPAHVSGHCDLRSTCKPQHRLRMHDSDTVQIQTGYCAYAGATAYSDSEKCESKIGSARSGVASHKHAKAECSLLA